MKLIQRIFGVAIIIMLLTAPQAFANADSDVSRAEAYMNSLHTVRADFIQQNSQGQTSSGQFWLQRPGRLRFQYKEPVAHFMVADGAFINFWDAKLQNQSTAPISQTLADFLLRDKIKFAGDVKVADVQNKQGELSVKLVQTTSPESGSITLIFDNQPLQLKQWQVVDAQGQSTTTSLLNPVMDEKFDPTLFVFKVPDNRR